ncbi:MAG: Sfum_1244 family protein, partial [Sulfurimicrobium sp.]
MDLSSLRATVQRNCHISDARHARNYTLCTYLLKMREFYRWEKGFPFDVSLPKDDLGDWITEREALWEQLEVNRFEPLRLGQSAIDPFETTAINQELVSQGLVYSGGYGGYAAPHFFLADLLRAERREGLPVFIAGREHARDMAAPPAMLLDGALFIRRESMRRMLWEKIEEWRWKQHQDAMARAMAYYDFDA